MIRSISFLLILITFSHFGFSQEKEFERFIGELTTYKSQSEVVVYEDSIILKDDYELKWINISGTYGGSHYCCGGKLIKANSAADTLFTSNTLLEELLHHEGPLLREGVLPPLSLVLNHKIEMIGD